MAASNINNTTNIAPAANTMPAPSVVDFAAKQHPAAAPTNNENNNSSGDGIEQSNEQLPVDDHQQQQEEEDNEHHQQEDDDQQQQQQQQQGEHVADRVNNLKRRREEVQDWNVNNLKQARLDSHNLVEETFNLLEQELEANCKEVQELEANLDLAINTLYDAQDKFEDLHQRIESIIN